MEIARPEFRPEPGMEREAMLAMQARVRRAATFAETPETPADGDVDTTVAGVDLAFDDDTAVAAAVAIRGGHVQDRRTVRAPVALPYIPGLLAFREAGPMADALAALEADVDLVLCDGNGRLHPREAGLATHVGVLLDRPTVGVAKGLLCGTLADGEDPPFPEGTRVPVHSDGDVQTDVDGPLGYAVQTRQWERAGRSINPVYVSPGHRVSTRGAVDLVLGCCAGYKLPEPVRRADRLTRTARDEG